MEVSDFLIIYNKNLPDGQTFFLTALDHTTGKIWVKQGRKKEDTSNMVQGEYPVVFEDIAILVEDLHTLTDTIIRQQKIMKLRVKYELVSVKPTIAREDLFNFFHKGMYWTQSNLLKESIVSINPTTQPITNKEQLKEGVTTSW